MKSHYLALAAQLEADIKEAWGVTSVYFGQPRNRPANDYATVRTTIDRENIGRSVHNLWSFEIEGSFIPPQGVMLETYLVEKGDALLMKLAPYTEDAPGTPLDGYADTAGSRYVGKVEPLDFDEQGKFAGVRLTFSCISATYQ